MKWNGYFKSIDDRVYFVELEKNDGNDTTKSLKFSDDPVEIVYESEEYIYKPIKASTATITIITKEYDKDLYSISGRDVKVVIYDSTDDVVVWKGYLTPNIYSQDYDEQQTELELECQDELSALKYIDANNLSGTLSFEEIIETTLGTTFSSGDIIRHFANYPIYNTIRYYYNNKGNKKLVVDGITITDDNINEYTDVLKDIYLNTSLFHTKEDEEDYTYFDILEQLFTFLNFTIYQEAGKYHITHPIHNDYKMISLGDGNNMYCQLNKTSTYKSFKYTHKPKLKTQEFDLFEGIEGNEEKGVEFHSTNPYTDSVKCPNLLLNEVINPFCYRYGRCVDTIGTKTLPTPGGLLQSSSQSIPTSITHKYKLPDSYNELYYQDSIRFIPDQYAWQLPEWTGGDHFSQGYGRSNKGYWDFLKFIGADFVKIGLETNSDEQLGLLIHQPIQNYNYDKLPEIDVLLFYRQDLSSGTIHDNKWSKTYSAMAINSVLDEQYKSKIEPVLSFDTDIDVDEFTQYLSFEVEGKAIMNPEMFIGSRSDYSDSVGYPAGKVDELDKETGSDNKGEWNNHYAFKISLPIEIQIGDDYRLSRNEINTGAQWWNGGLFDGMSFPKVVNKKDKPFSVNDVYMLELTCDTVEGDLRDSSSIVATLKGKIKPYDIQGQTFKTRYSAVSNGLSIGNTGGEYGLKDVEDCNVLAFNNTIGAKGKLKCTIFSLPPANLYDSSGVALSGDTALNGLYRYVGYWLQGFFITKFKIKEHQRNEIYYEKIYDKDNDDDIEYNIVLNENSFEELDDVECMIGNHDSFVSAISKPSLTKYYLDETNSDDTKIVLTKTAPLSTDIFTPKDNTKDWKEIDLKFGSEIVKMEDYTIRNVIQQYKDSKIILDIKTHINGQFKLMSSEYYYFPYFSVYFYANSVTYNLKSNIAELNLQEKKY